MAVDTQNDASDVKVLFPSQRPSGDRPAISPVDMALGAPYAPFPRSMLARHPRLEICEALASAKDVQDALALRSQFRVGDYPDPYLNDVLRAFRLLRGKRTYLEVGTFDRGNLAYMANLMADDALLIGLDIQDEPIRDGILRSKLRSGQSYKPVVGSSRSREAVAQVKSILNGRKLDAIFIDGDHTAYGAMCDYANFEDVIDDSGVILFHDSVWEGDGAYKGVADALDEVSRYEQIYLIDGATPCRKFSRPLWRGDLWGVVGVVFADEQSWRSDQRA